MRSITIYNYSRLLGFYAEKGLKVSIKRIEKEKNVSSVVDLIRVEGIVRDRIINVTVLIICNK